MQQIQRFRLKGMVCNRCITILRSSLESLPLRVEELSLGELTISGLQSTGSYSQLEHALAALDFEIVEDRNRRVVRQAKEIIRELLSRTDGSVSGVRIPELLSRKLNLSYDTIRDVFAEAEGVSVAGYVIGQRVEKVKEYIRMTGMSLTEIAFLTGYSSVFHLSSQFKEITSITPGLYRQRYRPLAQAKFP